MIQFHACRAVLMINQGPMGLSFSIYKRRRRKEQRRTTARRRHAVKKKKKRTKDDIIVQCLPIANLRLSLLFLLILLFFPSSTFVVLQQDQIQALLAPHTGECCDDAIVVSCLFFLFNPHPFHQSFFRTVLRPLFFPFLTPSLPHTTLSYPLVITNTHSFLLLLFCFVLRENDETTIMISVKTKYHFICDAAPSHTS
jgi:hypothetical protein